MTNQNKFNDLKNAKKIPDKRVGKSIWDKLVNPSVDNEEANLSRLLNGILLILIVLGCMAVVEYSIRHGFIVLSNTVPVAAMILLSLAYILNRRGQFKAAVSLSLSTITISVFATLWLNRFANNNPSILFYLVIPILMAEFFLPITRYIMAAVLILFGVLLVQHYDPGAKDIASFLTMFSATLGVAGFYRQKLEAARQEKLLSIERHHTRQMELLNSITHTSLQMPDTRQTLQVLADQLGQLLDADGAFITLWDEATGQVIPASAYGEFRNTYPNMKFAPDENTLTASVLREGRAIPVEDVFNTPYMNPELASDVPSRSALALPLIANNRKLGAALISYNKHRRFTTEEIAFGEQAARQIALAVFKAQLYDNEIRRATQLGLLEEVGRRIADSFDEMEILQRALKAVVDKFGYAEAAISLLTSDGLLEVTAITGTEDFGYRPGFRQERGKGIIGYVAQTRESYIANEVSEDPYYFSTARRHGSAAGVPMLDKDQLLGVIYVESTRPADFDSEDIQTLQTLANQVATSLQKARLYAITQEHLNIMTTLQSVSQVVMSSLELKEIFRNVLELLQNSFGYTYISIYLLDGDTLRLGTELGYPEDLTIFEIPITTGIIGRTARTKTTQFIPDVNKDPAFLRASYEVKSEICVPLLKEDNVLGVLNVESKEENPLKDDDVNLLVALAGPLAIAIDNARLHAEVKTMALTDTLSGLANRRAFDEILSTEVTRANRYKDQLSLIILDLDSFKEFNDHYGHPAGDVRLREIGEMLKENVREPDLSARYGGEEFAIILPSTSKEGAVRLAERLRRCAEIKAPLQNNDHRTIPGYTISLGVATFPDDALTLDDLVLAADNAELTAKRLGKNRVHAADTLDTHTT